MTDLPAIPDEAAALAPTAVPRRARWPTVLAWVTIAATAVAVAVGQSQRSKQPAANDDAAPSVEQPSFVFELQAKYLVGTAAMLPQQKAAMLAQVHTLKAGPLAQQQRYVALVGELGGPAPALIALEELDRQADAVGLVPTAEQANVREALQRLYQRSADAAGQLPELAPADNDVLIQQLGWLGQLALHPAGSDQTERDVLLAPAIRLFVALLGTVLGLGALACLGFAGLLGLAIGFATRFVRPALDEATGHAGLYAETFAIWLLLFSGLSFLPALLPPQSWLQRFGLLPNLLFSFLSLAALGWPVLRGVPWRQVRAEIGLTAGRRPLLEPFCGLAAYAMLLPLLAVGMLCTLFLIQRQNAGLGSGFDAPQMPMHPIVPLVGGGDWWLRLQVLLLASVSAPIVEEIMFRGVLYRHLRDGTHRLRFWASALLSGAVSSLVFAVIHPQGLATVPALMSIALGLCLAREWRGTLVPGIVAHGLHNGLIMLLLMTIAG